MRRKLTGVLKAAGLVAVALVITASVPTQADAFGWNGWRPHRPYRGRPSVPEINPGTLVSAISLAAGGLAMLRGRRGKRD
jgi:hypothetical protein